MKVWELINALKEMPFDAEICTLTRPETPGGLWEQETMAADPLFMEKDHKLNQIGKDIVVIY